MSDDGRQLMICGLSSRSALWFEDPPLAGIAPSEATPDVGIQPGAAPADFTEAPPVQMPTSTFRTYQLDNQSFVNPAKATQIVPSTPYPQRVMLSVYSLDSAVPPFGLHPQVSAWIAFRSDELNGVAVTGAEAFAMPDQTPVVFTIAAQQPIYAIGFGIDPTAPGVPVPIAISVHTSRAVRGPIIGVDRTAPPEPTVLRTYRPPLMGTDPAIQVVGSYARPQRVVLNYLPSARNQVGVLWVAGRPDDLNITGQATPGDAFRVGAPDARAPQINRTINPTFVLAPGQRMYAAATASPSLTPLDQFRIVVAISDIIPPRGRQ